MRKLLPTLSKKFSNPFWKRYNLSAIKKNHFILYKIVDSYQKAGSEYFKIQYINTKALLELTIEQIIFDFDILYGLHPIQGCFVGIEYAKTIKESEGYCPSQYSIRSQQTFSKYLNSRYGSNVLIYQDRSGMLGFQNQLTNENHLMDPRDIALSREIIEEFDATQAFCIGVLAGLKLANSGASYQSSKKSPYLHVVK